jgi:uncharacterized protein YjbJ (UPF0337 family)
MNWSSIESGWTHYTANAKEQWSKLSNEQIEGTFGKRNDLAMRVQEAYAVSEGEAQRQISHWQSRQVEVTVKGRERPGEAT